MEQHTPLLATNHYRNHAGDYNQIRARLSATRQKFLDSDMSGKVRMLQMSHSFAVLSVQTPVDTHEKAFTKLWEHGLPVLSEVEDAIKNCNYYKSKARYIRDSLQRGRDWEKVARMLMRGDVDDAHKFIIDEFLGVSTVKAPFVLAMLGFQEKMCLDTNLLNLMGLEKPSTVVVEKYQALCDSVRERFPSLSRETTPFVFQWVLFDYKRGEISFHDTFFKQLGVME